MLRRSAHVLPRLLVCLFAAYFVVAVSADASLRVDESATRARLTRESTEVALAFVNPTGRDVRARVTVELLDPAGDTLARDEREEQISPGANSLPFSLRASILNPKDRARVPWYRLRYVVTPVEATEPPASFEGIVSLSEIAPELFELSVTTPEFAFEGMRFRARVRASNPVSLRPVKGVRVEGTVALTKVGDETKTFVRAAGVTDYAGIAELDFDLPRGIAAGDAKLSVTGRLGDFEQQADDDVTLYHTASILVSTDKPLYQPGQTLHVRALFIDQFARRAIPDAEAKLKIRDPDGTNVFTATLRTSRFGVASCDWPIADNTRLGDYFVYVEMEDGAYENSAGGQQVRISRYELPTYVVNVKPDKKFYMPGENAEVEVRADYLFGEPVKRGHVRVVREAKREWNYKEQKWDTDEGETHEGDTDTEGRFNARVSLAEAAHDLEEDDEHYQRFVDAHFAAYFTDPTTNRTEQRRFDLRVTREPIHVYVVEKSYSHPADFPEEFYVTAFYADGTPARANIAVTENAAPPDVASAVPPGAFAPTALLEVKTNRFGLAKISRLLLGNLRKRDDGDAVPLKFTARDAAGRMGTTKEVFRLDDADETRIRVETDKTIYRAGETVRAVVTSNRRDLTLALDVMKDFRVLRAQTVRLRGGRARLWIPYAREFRGEVTLAAYTLPENGEKDNANGGSRVVLFPHESELRLDVKTGRRQYKPGEEASAEIRVHDAEGREVESVVGLVVTDRAVEERTRTEQEFGSGSGGYVGDFLNQLGARDSLAGVTERDLERLDLSKPLPEGLDLLAEIMFNKYSGAPVNTFGGGFTDDQHSVFASLLERQLKPVHEALAAHYKARGEYPRDEQTLRRYLTEAGLNLDAMRDPWGTPYKIRFGTERDQDLLEIISSAADKRDRDEDDFVALRESWPYFRPFGETINQVSKDYFERTHQPLRERQTLAAESLRAGLDLNALRDRWGRPYDVQLDIEGRNAVLKILSGGPDGRLSSERKSSYDDFTVWTSRVDYFADADKRISAALDRFVGNAHPFPRNETELRAALRASGVEESVLIDAWGRPYILNFTETEWNPGSVVIRSYARDGETPKERADALPARRRLFQISFRSSGQDAQPNTSDDIPLASFSRVLDVEARPAPAVMSPARTSQTAEVTDGALTGTVTDSNGAAIPRVTVRCVNKATGEARETTTNDEGFFVFAELPAGAYEVNFSASGFVGAIVTDVPVNLASITETNVLLRPGGTTETVTVTASSGAMLETSSSQFSARQIENLPINGRRLSSFAVLRRGAVNVVTKSGTTETPRLREYFPETLLWQPSLETDASGRASLRFRLADNITTWKMSLVGSTLDGQLGLAETELRAFQPFFIEHDPPRVLTEGDEISLPVVLRNYLARAQDVRLEFKPESWFTLLGPSEKRANVPAGDTARETFDFRAAASIEDGKQRVTAYGSDDSDAIERAVSVHPDGEQLTETAGRVFTDSSALDINFPASTIAGTARAELKIYPNLSAHIVEGVEGILRRPYGCGEQTISSTYPSLLVLRHFKQRGGELPPAARKAAAYVAAGYERLLGYRDEEGGFTYWGHGDADTALTAYALQFLTDARASLEVDSDITDEARAWLVKRQRADGAWPAHEWQGTNGENTLRLTAQVARSLAESGVKAKVENAKNASAVENAKAVEGESVKVVEGESAKPSGAGGNQAGAGGVQAGADGKEKTAEVALRHAFEFLRPRVEKTDDVYMLASFVIIAESAGEREAASVAARRLLALRRDEGDESFWDEKGLTPFHGWGLAARIETTALALRALHSAGATQTNASNTSSQSGASNANAPQSGALDAADSYVNRALLFLFSHKDDYGVWHSTQATVNVLDALDALSSRGGAKAGNVQRTPDSQVGDTAEVFVNSRHAATVQLPSEALSALVVVDLSPFVNVRGANRVEIRRARGASQATAHVVSTYFVPWTYTTDARVASNDARGTNTDARDREAGVRAARADAATVAPRLRIAFDHTEGEAARPVNCTVEVERGSNGDGMLLAEVGLPPGAEVDRASLESALKDTASHLYRYDVLPDRVVLYLWPYGGATARLQFKFTPRYGVRALTAASQIYDYYNPEARSIVPPTRFVIR